MAPERNNPLREKNVCARKQTACLTWLYLGGRLPSSDSPAADGEPARLPSRAFASSWASASAAGQSRGVALRRRHSPASRPTFGS